MENINRDNFISLIDFIYKKSNFLKISKKENFYLIDTKGKNKECVRECTKTYSYSISQGNQVGFKTETLRAARDAYQICINTCE